MATLFARLLILMERVYANNLKTLHSLKANISREIIQIPADVMEKIIIIVNTNRIDGTSFLLNFTIKQLQNDFVIKKVSIVRLSFSFGQVNSGACATFIKKY